MKLTLVEDVKLWWRWVSIRAMAASIAVQSAWAGLPDDLRRHFPAWIVTTLSIGLLCFGIGGRLVQQKKPGTPND